MPSNETDEAMAKKVTLEQVAQHSGVSPATVSRVINHPSLVSAKTINRVNASIQELGYSSLIDQYRDRETTDAGTADMGHRPIVVNLPWLDNPFYSEIVRGIRVAARIAGYDVLVSWDVPKPANADEYCAMLKGCNASGLITLCPLTTDVLGRIDATLPVVQCCESNPESGIPYVTIDDAAAAQTAVEHLVSCGCTQLAIVGGPRDYKYSRGRMEGFLNVVRDHGLTVNPSWILQVPDNNYALAYSAVCHMLESEHTPDGIFCCSDTYGAAVVRAAKKAGLVVPDDLMVVGFDNVDLATMVTPSLTTVNQPRYRMGYTACSLLLERLMGGGTARSMTLETELIVRESTTRAHAQQNGHDQPEPRDIASS